MVNGSFKLCSLKNVGRGYRVGLALGVDVNLGLVSTTSVLVLRGGWEPWVFAEPVI